MALPSADGPGQEPRASGDLAQRVDVGAADAVEPLEAADQLLRIRTLRDDRTDYGRALAARLVERLGTFSVKELLDMRPLGALGARGVHELENDPLAHDA
jgi:hypothetical protein